MRRDERKAVLASYKERKVGSGVYAVTCSATGQRWLGTTPDLDTVQNRLWFTLRLGNHRNAELQGAWNTHGAEAFAIQEIERLEEEPDAYLRDKLMGRRLAHFLDVTGAKPILP